MQIIHVDLGAHAYNIEIEAGLLPQIGAKVAKLLPKAKKAAIISDTNVAPLYAAKLEASLTAAGLAVVKVVIEAGEQSKNMTVLSSVLEQLAQGGLDILTPGRDVPGRGNIVAAGERIFRLAAHLQQHFDAARVPTHDPHVRGAVPDALGMGHSAGNGLPGGVALLVNNIQNFRHRGRFLSYKLPTV